MGLYSSIIIIASREMQSCLVTEERTNIVRRERYLGSDLVGLSLDPSGTGDLDRWSSVLAIMSAKMLAFARRSEDTADACLNARGTFPFRALHVTASLLVMASLTYDARSWDRAAGGDLAIHQNVIHCFKDLGIPLHSHERQTQ